MKRNALTTPLLARKALTLIETIAAMVILATAIPPAAAMLLDATHARTHVLQSERATWLAAAILENIIADVASSADGLGFEALAQTQVYLNHPQNGLLTRLEETVSHYQSLGIEVDVAISELVSQQGVPTGDSAQDLYRLITVTASWSSWNGTTSIELARIVTAL